jgi:hypothetical protein
MLSHPAMCGLEEEKTKKDFPVSHVCHVASLASWWYSYYEYVGTRYSNLLEFEARDLKHARIIIIIIIIVIINTLEEGCYSHPYSQLARSMTFRYHPLLIIIII